MQVLEILQHCLSNSLELVEADGEMFEFPVPHQPAVSPGGETVLAEVQPLQPSQGGQEVGVQGGLVLVLAPVTDPVPHQGAGHVEFPEAGQVDGQGPSPCQAETENQNEREEQRLTWRG